MTYPRIYPSPCPVCDAPPGQPCSASLTHPERLIADRELISQRGLEAAHPSLFPRPAQHCKCAERRK